MKTDRELLELAAKAIGYKGQVVETVRGLVFRVFPDNPIFEPVDYDWLHDDGDILRLAVALQIDVVFDDIGTIAQSYVGQIEVECNEFQCANAACRRAVLLAAAEIGEAME